MKKNILFSILLLFVIHILAFTQEVSVTKITDKVIVLTVTRVSNCNIVAISSEEGIILVDTEISPLTMEIVKEEILKQFPGQDFIYVINTHAHSHHCGGNALFKDIPIIAHQNIIEDMQWWFDMQSDEEMKQEIIGYYKKNIADCDESIKEHAGDESEVAAIQEVKKYWKKRCQEIENGFEVIVPDIRFSDEMKLQLTDMTLNLIYFGLGHSKSDILIHIPQEKVLIAGATIIMDLPSTHHSGDRERDIARWISVLKNLNDDINTIETVVPGHGGLRDRASFQLHYEYFSEMYENVDKMVAEGASMDAAKEMLSLENGFSHFASLQDLSEDEQERHLKNLEIFWNYINKASGMQK